MKMPASEFAMLKADFMAYVEALQESGPFNYSDMRNAWAVYHRVMDDRSYDDSHPFYSEATPEALRRRRVLPYKGREWNSRFYNMGLNDSHIETALRKIVAA